MSIEAVAAARTSGPQVIVLPELVTSGYVFTTPEEAGSLAIDAEHEVFERWAAAADGAVVVAGFCERGQAGAIHNSVAVVDGSALTVYRKTHLWGTECSVFTPGRDRPPVVPTSIGPIGVLLCYDLEFPEITRDLALRGAELIVVPANWPLVPRPEGEHPPEVVIAMAAARVNRVAIACCDRGGTERGQRWTGGSAVIDHEGWVVASAETAGVAVAEIDLSRSRDKQLGPHNHAFDDRRPSLYGDLPRQ